MKTIQMPYDELARALGVNGIYLKREDQHKYGSHKGRSLPLMIKKYFKDEGKTDFVISSSGNAALAAVEAIQAHNRNNDSKLNLTVFVGQNINPQKLKKLIAVIEDVNIKLEQVENPKQSAFQMDKDGKAQNLRQSTDDTALEGYFELAQELDKIPNLCAVFIPTSSGTTAQALGEAFGKLSQRPQIHIVQTTACHPIVSGIEDLSLRPELRPRGLKIEDSDNSIADAIVDKIAHRKEKVVEAIKSSRGSGWIVDNDEIKDAIKLVKEACNLAISPNSALSVAGLSKAVKNGWKWDGVIVCLITGI
jgi:threonine synthase